MSDVTVRVGGQTIRVALGGAQGPRGFNGPDLTELGGTGGALEIGTSAGSNVQAELDNRPTLASVNAGLAEKATTAAVDAGLAAEAAARTTAVDAVGGRVTLLEGTVTSGRLAYKTYAGLAANTTAPVGTVAEVPITDAGTHTDPVVGGTVNNTGVFRWSASPAGWERLYDVDAASAAGYATAAQTSATSAASAVTRLRTTLDEPNLFTHGELEFRDTTYFDLSSPGGLATLAASTRQGSGAWKLTAAAGAAQSKWRDFPRSKFGAATNFSASIKILEVEKAGARFDIFQYNAAGTEIPSTRQTTTLTASATSRVIEYANVAIHADCVNIRFYLIVIATGDASARSVWFRDMSIAAGASATYAPPRPIPAVDQVGDVNLYSSANNYIDGYINGSGVVTAGSGFRFAIIPVRPGGVYAVRIPDIKTVATLSGTSFFGVFSTSSRYTGAITGSANLIVWQETSDPYVWLFVVPNTPTITHAFFNAKLGGFDYTSSLVVQAGTAVPDSTIPYVAAAPKTEGLPVKDVKAREGVAFLLSAHNYYARKIITFGDSVTEGTSGGYQKYLSTALGCTVKNFGSSGAQSGRLVGIMTNQANRQEATTFSIKPDYTTAEAITIMIGTNDVNAGKLNGSAADIPAGSIYDVPDGMAGTTDTANTNAYWASFPDTFWGNVSMCIEYAKWKNPRVRIYIVTYPHRAASTTTAIDQIEAMHAAIADFYSLPHISAARDSGMIAKNVSYLFAHESPGSNAASNHLGPLGNEMFGKWLARKLVSA